MRRMMIALVMLAAATAVAACDPTVDNGILGIGVVGNGGGGGVATRLVFTAQPQSVQATAAMPDIIVQAEDGVGQVDTTYSDVITLALSSNPDSAVLGGNFSVTAINGVATLSNVTISKADTGYVLIAASGTLTSAFSSKFTITP